MINKLEDMSNNAIINRDKVLQIIKEEGPLLPINVSKRMGVSTTIAGAMLSEMIASKLVNITNVKYGGSPFYYLPGQEERLDALTVHLNEKDQRTAQLLKEKNFLKDRDLSPLQRVGLRQMKDFAKSIQVKLDTGEIELFWKWYLVEDEKAKQLITDYINSKTKPKKEKKDGSLRDHIGRIKIKKEELKIEEPLEVFEEKPVEIEKIEEKIIEEDNSLEGFFKKNDIEIANKTIIKKDKEINFTVNLKTKVGKLAYFLKYRDKRKINETDVILALHEASKLPLFFLYTGELNKKAKEMMNREFKGVVFKKL